MKKKIKINNKYNEKKIGRIYHYDVSNSMSSIHQDTKTVKVLKIVNRQCANPLATLKCMQTGDVFDADIGHLQLSPEFLKSKYYKLRRYYKSRNRDMILKYKSFGGITTEYIVIGIDKNVNQIVCIDRNGVAKQFGYNWFKFKDRLDRNHYFDRYMEEQDRFSFSMYKSIIKGDI